MSDPRRPSTRAAVVSLMGAGVVASAQIGKGGAALPVLQSEFTLSPTAGAWWLSIMSAIGAIVGAAPGRA